jgi:hypothetical protein
MADTGSSVSSVEDEIEAIYDFLDRQAEVDGPDPCRIERAFESISQKDDGSLVVQSITTGRLTTGDGGFIGAPSVEQHRDRWHKRDGRWVMISVEKPPPSAPAPRPPAPAAEPAAGR